jgi:hypothetical protein
VYSLFRKYTESAEPKVDAPPDLLHADPCHLA